ncbi:hypothetical protein FXO37_01626 [Capsicum annuum]|nr:hypothetical protein FXO37_01626 [Capsicum annuum]
MDRYYPGMDKVMRSVFYDDFFNKKITFRVEDLYETGLVYFISRFLQSELPRTFIKKADFDLIESDHYLKYDWGGERFQYVFRDIVFTNKEEVKFNLGAIHQDSLGHEHRNDSDHSVPSISEDKFTVLKNEIANVRRDMPLFQEKVFKEMIEYQKKVDSEFNGMREFVQESMKLILNELRLVKQKSSEFVEKKSPLDDIPFFTESQLVALEPTFRVLKTPKAHIAMPVVFGKSSEDVYNQSDTSFRRCLLYFKSKHPFLEYIDFETPNLLIEQFTDWCYPNSKSRGKRCVF